MSETDIVVVPNTAGGWNWRFTVDGETEAEGTAATYAIGMAAARAARWVWEEETPLESEIGGEG